MTCLEVKLLLYLSALENAIVFKGAVQMSRFTLTPDFTLLGGVRRRGVMGG